MGVKKRMVGMVNALLRPLGVRVVPLADGEKPWDGHFAKWIAEARSAGGDPNDLGDLDWNNDPLKAALDEHYFPHIDQASVVLELGPGTGRLTRHIISRCREMVLVDYSGLVCRWLEEYLAGKGKYRVYRIETPSLGMLPSDSIDVAIANGVFEHLDPDEMLSFLEEFHRILKPGGVASFNFDNMMSEEGMRWFRRWRGQPGDRCIFRFYHPDGVRRLAESSGFETLRLTAGQSRLAHIEIRKPPASQGRLPEPAAENSVRPD